MRQLGAFSLMKNRATFRLFTAAADKICRGLGLLRLVFGNTEPLFSSLLQQIYGDFVSCFEIYVYFLASEKDKWVS